MWHGTRFVAKKGSLFYFRPNYENLIHQLTVKGPTLTSGYKRYAVFSPKYPSASPLDQHEDGKWRASNSSNEGIIPSFRDTHLYWNQ